MRTFEGPGAVSFHPRVLGLPMIVGVLLGACSGVGPTSGAPDSETPALSAGTRDWTSATVTWTAPATDESITGYELQWRISTDTEWTPVTGIAISKTSYTITGLQPETTYRVRVRALFAATDGAWSEPIEVSTTAPPPSPEPPPAAEGPRISWPTAGANSTVTASSITVRWTAPATDEAITGYELQWRSTTDTEWTPVTGIASTKTSYTITGLQPETTYEVQVRALFATTAGAWSESITVSTTSDRLTLTLAEVTGESIAVTWVAPATARSDHRLRDAVARCLSITVEYVHRSEHLDRRQAHGAGAGDHLPVTGARPGSAAARVPGPRPSPPPPAPIQVRRT